MQHIGVPLEYQSARMGHSNIQTTVGVYGHFYEGAGRSVADKPPAHFSQAKRRDCA